MRNHPGLKNKTDVGMDSGVHEVDQQKLSEFRQAVTKRLDALNRGNFEIPHGFVVDALEQLESHAETPAANDVLKANLNNLIEHSEEQGYFSLPEANVKQIFDVLAPVYKYNFQVFQKKEAIKFYKKVGFKESETVLEGDLLL